MNERLFHLSDILTVTTGRFLSNRGMEGVYDILDFLTGETLFTHQIPRALRACREPIFRQHPRLREVNAQDLDLVLGSNGEERVNRWLKNLITEYGTELPLSPLTEVEYKAMHPLEEALEMREKN